MIVLLSRAVMGLAVRCLGQRHAEWAAAMQSEFAAAVEDGRPFGFALGCLGSALRLLPGHEEGRLILASHAVVLGVVVPLSAFFLSASLVGLPFLQSAQALVDGPSIASAAVETRLNRGNIAAAPALTLLILTLATLHLTAGWALLDRNWQRVAAIARLSAAATVTLALFTSVIFLDQRGAVLPLAGLVIELAAITMVARWHERLDPDTA